MKKDIVSALYQRYLKALAEGKEPYFDADEVDELLNDLEDADNYTHYEEILSLGLKLHPDNLDLQLRNCHSLVDNNKYKEALTVLDALSKTNNQETDTLRLECYAMLDRFDEFYRYLDRLITNKVDYLEQIFEFFVPIMEDYDKERDVLLFIEKSLSFFPLNRTLNEELCYQLENGGRIGEAIEVCNKLIDLDPYDYGYWFMLGRLYSMSSQFEKAIEALDFALACNDSEPEIKLLKGYCLYMNENYEKAIEVYQEMQKDKEINLRINPFIAECFMKIEKYEEAYRILKKIAGIKDIGDDPSVYANIVHCCIETDREKEADTYLKEAVRLFPGNTHILALQALFYSKTGKNEFAAQMTTLMHDLLINRIESGKENSRSLFEAAQYLFRPQISSDQLIREYFRNKNNNN